jgi:hypothetical protein
MTRPEMTTELGRMETEIWRLRKRMAICDRECESSGNTAGSLTTKNMSALITRATLYCLFRQNRTSQ